MAGGGGGRGRKAELSPVGPLSEQAGPRAAAREEEMRQPSRVIFINGRLCIPMTEPVRPARTTMASRKARQPGAPHQSGWRLQRTYRAPGTVLDAKDTTGSQGRAVPTCLGFTLSQRSSPNHTQQGEIAAEASLMNMTRNRIMVVARGCDLGKSVRKGLPKEVAIGLCFSARSRLRRKGK